jgi:hypothetical protein
VLAISSLVVTFNGTSLIADYTLTETSGLSNVDLVSMTFEESGGRSDFLDPGCWGDYPIRVFPGGSIKRNNAAMGDWCQPVIATKTPGDSASLIVVYKHNDGTQETVRATVPIRRG